MKATFWFDGGSRGNPGPYGCAVVIQTEYADRAWGEAKYLGARGTVNEAEYEGLIWGLTRAHALGVTHVQAISDSKLVVEQVMGSWTINHEHLRVLAERAVEFAQRFDIAEIRHVRREKNKVADRLVTDLLDARVGARRGDKKKKKRR